MTSILILADNIERTHFFLRLARSAVSASFEVLFITSCSQSYHLISAQGFDVVDLCRLGRSKFSKASKPIEGSLEQLISPGSSWLYGFICRTIESNLYAEVEKLRTCDVALIWNGNQFVAKVVDRVLKDIGVNRIKYLELSNLPGKLFCDSRGVNAASSLAKSATLLDALSDVDQEFHTSWVHSWKVDKKKPIGQAKNKKSFGLLSYIYEIIDVFRISVPIKILFLIASYDSLVSRFSRIKNIEGSISFISDIPDKYSFFPMQVSTDTQILINGCGWDNSSVIEHAIAEGDIPLVVKFHPAEKNIDYIFKVYEKYKGKVLFSDIDTLDLIESSEQVITINSTVGLEAMILGVDVKVMGLALYKEFDQGRLRKYIHRYLIGNVDYFSDKPVSEDSLLRVLD